MSQQKVLIVEDDAQFADLLAREITALGFEVDYAEDGKKALTETERIFPDLILLDIILPEMDGYQVLEAIRNNANEKLKVTPVIVVSNLGQPEEISRAIQYGISDYVVKSTSNPSAIAEKVRRKLIKEPPPPLPGAVPAGKLKILVIEDDKFLRDLEVQKLQKEPNLSVFAAMDGEQGVSIAEKELPDIILLDILLPGIDGFEVLTRVKSNPVLARAKVIMLSNFGQREDIERAQKLGAMRFLIKANYTLDEIVAEVRDVAAQQ